MNLTYDICKNCGGEYGIHHYSTNQCPVGGREASVNQRQEWMATVFEKENSPIPETSLKVERDKIEIFRIVYGFIAYALSLGLALHFYGWNMFFIILFGLGSCFIYDKVK